MTLINQLIPSGFGERLKSERKRLKLSQEELASIGGVKRLAQLQYESENTHPTTKYLNAIGAAGVDLLFVIFDLKKNNLVDLQIDDKVLEYIAKVSVRFPDGKLSPDAFRVLFRITKKILIQIANGELPEDYDVTAVISQSA